MTPLQIEMLLWYHSRTTDYVTDHRMYNAQEYALEFLKNNKLIAKGMETGTIVVPDDLTDKCYFITVKGKFYVEALEALPLPVEVKSWEIPQS